ncbi:MAG: DUF6675 family protein [Desulfobacteria bacterium]
MMNKPLYRRLPRVVALVVFATIVSGAVSSRADTAPQPPCGSASFPPYPDLEKSPAVRSWNRAESGRDWKPPACTGWADPGFTTLVVTVARFRHASGVEGLLRRIGAISKHAGVRYWSTSHKRWKTLITDAYALSEADGDRRRADFSPGEMAEGRSLYFRQEDNLAGKATYRMRIRSASPDRLVFDSENTSTIRYFLMTMFRPGGMQSITFLDRESRDVWRYYSITRTGRDASLLTAGYEASSINRSVAFYRYLAGIPTDKEPPASP